jgi:hypothetical protein
VAGVGVNFGAGSMPQVETLRFLLTASDVKRHGVKLTGIEHVTNVKTDSNKELQNWRGIPPFASYTVHISPMQKSSSPTDRSKKQMHYPAVHLARSL